MLHTLLTYKEQDQIGLERSASKVDSTICFETRPRVDCAKVQSDQLALENPVWYDPAGSVLIRSGKIARVIWSQCLWGFMGLLTI